MDLIEKLYNLTTIEQAEPAPGGSYHLAWIISAIAVTLILCAIVRRADDMVFRKIILFLWLVMVVFEAYKQTLFNAEMIDGKLVLNYDWSEFPFQLCSTPLYVLPWLALLKDGLIRDFAASFTMTYALIGGVAVYMFPGSVFTGYIVGNVQTMIHHGIQIATGVITAVKYRDRLNFKFFLKGFLTFVLLFTVAMLLNSVFRDYLISAGIMEVDETFNMFLVSPYMEFKSPAFEDVMLLFTPWQRVVLYFIGLPIGAAIVMLLLRRLLRTEIASTRRKYAARS